MKKNTIIFLILGLIIIGIIVYWVSAREAVAPTDTAIIPIEQEFSGKIVYTTDMGFDKKALANDCAKRGGQFNECGSVCETKEEMCIDVCAYTCEFTNEQSLLAQPSEFTAETIRLKKVSALEGDGIATREYDSQAFIHTVTAKLSDPQENKHYEGWLIKEDGGEDFFSTGRLEKAGGGYALTYTSTDNLLAYNGVLVTLEEGENSEAMGEKILYGVFGENKK